MSSLTTIPVTATTAKPAAAMTCVVKRGNDQRIGPARPGMEVR